MLPKKEREELASTESIAIRPEALFLLPYSDQKHSSCYHIRQHLVCNLDLYCGLLPFLANGMSVFVSALSIIAILLYYMVEISPVSYHFQHIIIIPCLLLNKFQV